MSTSKKEPKALTPVQFGSVLALLVICVVLALLSMSGVAGKHGKCETDANSARQSNPTCWPSYANLDKNGVVGFAPKSAS